MMRFKYFDTSGVKINKNIDIAKIDIPGSEKKIIIVDNVFKNPENIFNLLTKFPVEREPWCAFPGHRAHLNAQFGELSDFVGWILASNYGEETFDGWELCANVLRGDTKCKFSSLVPHVDHIKYAFSIWLNPAEECFGGTSFYYNKKFNTAFCDLNNDEDFDRYDLILSECTENKPEYLDQIDYEIGDTHPMWEEFFMAPMVPNSMVFYPGDLFHSVHMKKGWYTEYERVSLAGFI